MRPHALSLCLERRRRLHDHHARSSGVTRLPYTGRVELYPTFGGFEPPLVGVIPSREAKRTSSATEPACIWPIQGAGCSLPVATRVPTSPPLFWLNRPGRVRS